MSHSLSRHITEAFEAVTEEDSKTLEALDGSDARRIEARRRYEEFVDLPLSPHPLSAG